MTQQRVKSLKLEEFNLNRNKSAPRPAHAPFKRTLTLALLGPLAMVSLAQAAVIDIEVAQKIVIFLNYRVDFVPQAKI